jgi:hypothetical protein
MSSSTSSSEHIGTQRSYLLAFALAIAVALVANMLASQRDVKLPTGPSARRDQENLRAKKPEVALLGNSMLGMGVDPDLLMRLLKKRMTVQAAHGSASSFWYLYTKNVVGALEEPPPTLVVFFRDFFLTLPEFRVDGDFRKRLDDYSIGQEWDLQHLAYKPFQPPGDRFMEKYLPLHSIRNPAQEKLDQVIRTTAGDLLGEDGKIMETALGKTFDRSLSDEELVTKMQLDAENVTSFNRLDFPNQNARSFLPLMVEIAKEKNVQLVFVRVRRRENLTKPQPEALVQYINDLRAYLEENGAILLDFSGEERLQEEHYGDGDHLNGKGKTLFTQLLAERLAPHLEQGRPAQ